MSGIVQAMHEGVLVLDEDGRVGLVNPALREMLLLPADVVGKTVLEVIRHPELPGIIDRARAAEEPVRSEVEVQGVKPRRLLVRASTLHAEPRGLLVVLVDVTELRRLETLRRDFVANVSHELRTPVTTIRSSVETLKAGAAADPAAAARFLDIVERNAERLQQLVEDLLDLSRIESRQYRLRPESVDLGQVLGHAVSLLRERAEKKRLALLVETAPDLPAAKADRRALEQVVSNLIDNAVKYTGERCTVRVGAKQVSEKELEVAVTDDGPGIEPRHLPRLFERFYRVDAGRSREQGGTGLGLSIVKHLVEAMGGNVRVESEPGRRTIFAFTVPRA
jgi:two-component system phosphate regulon sensor histidine kinase PhoR